MIERFFAWFARLCNQHKFVRRYVIFSGTLIVWAILIKVFFIDDYTKTITEPVQIVLVAIIGLVGVVTTAYSVMKGKD